MVRLSPRDIVLISYAVGIHAYPADISSLIPLNPLNIGAKELNLGVIGDSWAVSVDRSIYVAEASNGFGLTF